MFGKGLLALAALIAAGPAAAEWREASSPHFVIYSEGSEAGLQDFAERLEKFDAAMRFMSHVPDWAPSQSNRLTIYMVPTINSVQQLSGPNVSNAAGFYIPRAGGSIAIVPRNAGPNERWNYDAETVLLHEYAHHFMFQNYTTPLPAWFTEGFAEFYATAQFQKDGTVGIGLPATHRSYGLLNTNALSLSEMMNYRSGVKLTNAERENLYGRGWLLTHYLAFEPERAGQLEAYIKALGSGLKGEAAAASAFGDLQALNGELNRYMRRKSLYFARLEPAVLKPAKVTMRTLRPGEGAVMELRIRSDRGVDTEQAKALVPEMRRKAAPFASDPWVQVTLAEAELDAGNLAEADAAADRALAARPDYPRAMLYKGMIAWSKAKAASDPALWKAARQWFVKANRADTEDARALLLYYQSFGAEGVKAPDAAVKGLFYAADLAREEPSIRLLAAREHLIAGNADSARPLLETIAYNPHTGGMGEFAGRIVAALEAGGPKAALTAWTADNKPAEPQAEKADEKKGG